MCKNVEEKERVEQGAVCANAHRCQNRCTEKKKQQEAQSSSLQEQKPQEAVSSLEQVITFR